MPFEIAQPFAGPYGEPVPNVLVQAFAAVLGAGYGVYSRAPDVMNWLRFFIMENYGDLVQRVVENIRSGREIDRNEIRQQVIERSSSIARQMALDNNIPESIIDAVHGAGQEIQELYLNSQAESFETPQRSSSLRGNTMSTSASQNERQSGRPVNVMPLFNTSSSAQMDQNSNQNVSEFRAATSSSGGGVGRPNGDTPVADQKPHYGIPETATAILPLTFYFSTGSLNKTKSTAVNIRMTSINDCLVQPTSAPVGPYPLTPVQGTLYNTQLFRNSTTFGGADLWPFPTKITDTPQWANVYKKLYDVYHVIRCHWTVRILPTATDGQGGVMVGYGYETKGSTGSGVTIPDEKPLHDAMYWPGITWKVAQLRNGKEDGDTVTTISGTYIPGSAHSIVINDEDKRTWTKVAEHPIFLEQLKLMIYAAPFAQNTTSRYINCNFEVTLKYVVQFKDIPQSIRFASGTGYTPFNVTYPTDILHA